MLYSEDSDWSSMMSFRGCGDDDDDDDDDDDNDDDDDDELWYQQRLCLQQHN